MVMFDPKTVHIEKRLFFVGGAVARHSTRTTFRLAGSRLLSAKPVQKEPQLWKEKAPSLPLWTAVTSRHVLFAAFYRRVRSFRGD